MAERKSVKLCTDRLWSKKPVLLEKGKINIVITSTIYEDRCVISFTDGLAEGLGEIIEGMEKSARVVTGQNPRICQIYTKGVSEDEARSQISGWLEKEGTGLEEVSLSDIEQE